MPANGFVLLFAALVMGTAFFGRAFSVPGALVVVLALRGEPTAAMPLAAVLLVVGERVTHLRRRVGRFVQRSFTDRLTGLFNYDFLQAQVRYEIDRVRRYGGSCSILVLDLDHFKRFNDTHGHQAGNLLLRALADAVRRDKRDSDFAARFGGEEFVVLVPGDATDAVRLAERLRGSVVGARAAAARAGRARHREHRRRIVPRAGDERRRAVRACGPGALRRQGQRSQPHDRVPQRAGGAQGRGAARVGVIAAGGDGCGHWTMSRAAPIVVRGAVTRGSVRQSR